MQRRNFFTRSRVRTLPRFLSLVKAGPLPLFTNPNLPPPLSHIPSLPPLSPLFLPTALSSHRSSLLFSVSSFDLIYFHFCCGFSKYNSAPTFHPSDLLPITPPPSLSPFSLPLSSPSLFYPSYSHNLFYSISAMGFPLICYIG